MRKVARLLPALLLLLSFAAHTTGQTIHPPLQSDQYQALIERAAEHAGIYTMASASVMQGQLSRGLPTELGATLPGLATDAQRALQFVRSTPGIGTALVGMKTVAHVEENAGVAKTPPVPWEQFQRLFTAA